MGEWLLDIWMEWRNSLVYRQTVHVGIVGTGGIGSWHARNLVPQAPDGAVVAITTGRLDGSTNA